MKSKNHYIEISEAKVKVFGDAITSLDKTKKLIEKLWDDEINHVDSYNEEAGQEIYEENKAYFRSLENNKRGIEVAKMLLMKNPEATWAALFLLYANLEETSSQLVAECINPYLQPPDIILDAFIEGGVKNIGVLKEKYFPAFFNKSSNVDDDDFPF